MDLPVLIPPHPECPFGPREPRVTATAGRRDCGEHTAGLRIDLLDTVLGELKQVLAVECRPGVRSDIERSHTLTTRRIDGVQGVASGKPDMPAVISHTVHVVDPRKGPVLADDFGR